MRHRSLGARLRSAALFFGLVVGIGLVFTTGAVATHGTPQFELEGDIADSAADPAPDWATRFDASGASLVGPSCALEADDLSQSGLLDRTVFTSSNKNDDPIPTWTWGTNNNPPKDDLANVYVCATTNAGGDTVLYGGLERLSADGATHVDYELFQADVGLDHTPPCPVATICRFTGSRTVGDIILSVDFTNGGAVGSVEIRRWNGTAYVLVTGGVGAGCNAADTICAFSNTSAIPTGPWTSYDDHANPITTLIPNQFTEFGVNLTAILGATAVPCSATALVKTRSSPSFSSTLMDFASATFRTCPTKSGQKFHDLNGNGAKDAGEPGLPGWTIRAYKDTSNFGTLDASEFAAGPTASAVTDASGNYVMTFPTGRYVVCEVLQAGWNQSYPLVAGSGSCSAGASLGARGWAINLPTITEDTGNDFGNYQQATKTGVKFLDANANGVKDAGEAGLSGWTINAFVDVNGNGTKDAADTTIAATTATGAGGTYTLSLAPGKYIVCEVQQAGWTQSFPTGSACGAGAGGWGITLTSGQLDSNNDFGNFQGATKTGVKFEDLNANSIRDAGEPALPGWTINAFKDTNSNGIADTGEPLIASNVTNASGVYTLNLPPGKYVICETQQVGWFQSWPANTICGVNAGGWAITLNSGDLDSGNDFGNYRNATKSGVKFEDLDADGVKDAGEPGLSGWTINAFVDTNANGILDPSETTIANSATTNGTGAYSMSLKPGRYVVCEVQQIGWNQSFPANTVCGLTSAGYGISLMSNQVDSDNDFGNWRAATKSGVKFNDLNANGIKEAGEPGLSGWTIQAFADTNGNGVKDAGENTVVASAVTVAGGAYSMSLSPGKYVVCEILQATWFQSFPSGTACGAGAAGYGITLTSGQLDSDNDFGNYQRATKTGTKFEDLNANGAKDAGEPGLPGWAITAYVDVNGNGTKDAGDTTVAASTTTNASGVYSLSLVPGKYIVCETQQSGWIQSFPTGTACGASSGGWGITLTSGQLDDNNDFGNYRNATKSGVKFNDLDGDGVKDAGEPGLSGWTINAYVDANGNGTRDAGENTIAASATTVAGGAYSMSLTPGRYVVCEVQQATWIQSFPSGAACGTGQAGYGIILTSGQVDSDNDFGNFQKATKTGTKFDDLNANGVKDAGEPGLSGWVIRAYVDANANASLDPGETTIAATDTTTASGAYSLSLNPGSYIVCEVAQATWTQSFPSNTKCAALAALAPGGWGITLTSGQLDDNNDFGNWRQATKSGVKFNDLDGDGVKDAGEPGLSGWTIQAFIDVDGNGTKDAADTTLAGSAITNATGAYSINLNPGKYVVCEVQQPTWIQSYPVNSACGLGLGGWGITLTSGQQDTDNDFGNFQRATKTGMKFEDLNANGVKDAGDLGLAGWTITAYVDVNGNGVKDAADVTVAASTTTGAGGTYSLSLLPGKYIVCETQQSGWTQSFPTGNACGLAAGGWGITLTSGQLDDNNDFGNWTNATKTGVKFEDLNGNGAKDAGEPGLPGWTISAYADANSNGIHDAGETLAASALTNGTGAYSLSLAPGKYVVCETQQAGWIQSFPAGIACGASSGGWAITLTSHQLDDNNDFGNYRKATKTGMKFNDLNANGQKDVGEPGLPGWIVRAFKDDNGNGTHEPGETTIAASDTTNGAGVYSMLLDPGKYVVCEVQQAGWFQSFPAGAACGAGSGGYGITLTSGQLDDNNDFGNYQAASKTGTKFDDLNANGVRDPGEPGLGGWTINAYADANGNGVRDLGEDTISATGTTNGLGEYSLTLTPGKYVVCEVQQPGWIQSFPGGTACGAASGGWGITLTSGQTDSGNDFGNYRNATKTGMKFEDLNANGAKDAGEPGLPGWTIAAFNDVNSNGIFDAADTPAAATTTNAAGVYTLTLKPGQYVVCEGLLPGWIQSYPVNPVCGVGGWAITLISGQIDSDNDFGNYRNATKSGMKFEDTNANGVKDAGEPGLPGWTINAFADTNGNGILDPLELVPGPVNSTVTGAGGAYSMSLKPGKYVVCEALQAGWIQSFPSGTACGPFGAGYGITLISGQVDSDNDFGNYQNAIKTGMKFDDLNASGAKDAGEPGLPGWTIRAFVDDNGDGTLQAGETTIAATDITGAGGVYSLTLKPGKYIVCEVQQATWIQSFPSNAVCGTGAAGWAITLVSGQRDVDNDFGNYRNAQKLGTKFNDLNANGVKDAGEPGLPGWNIRAFADDNGNGLLDPAETTIAATDITNAAGDYTLILKPGKYIVCEVLQPTWIQSFPANAVCGGAGGWAITLQSGETDRDNNFGNYQRATKTGMKFDDLNANGAKDAGEPGLPGWSILAFSDLNGNGLLDGGEPIAASDVTNAAGVYSLSLIPGKYVVCEIHQAGWIQSYPQNEVCVGSGGWAITLTSGQLDSDNDFGNYRNATKSGVKFDDLNANGVKDAGEPGLPGWTINAFPDLNGNGVLDIPLELIGGPVNSAVTGGGGAYSMSLKPGKYVVCEVQQAGWIQSFPAGTACDGLGAGYGITLISGQQDTDNDFGNYRNATKTGMKFDDLNANGAKDAGEPGLPGWVIRAYADDNGNGMLDPTETTIVTSDVTSPTGTYSLTLKPGKYVVCEVQQAGWFQSFPAGTACGATSGGWGITLISGQLDSGNDFGNYRAASKTGTKFDDLNANGVKDPGEPGLPGWTINAYVDANANGVRDLGEDTIAGSSITNETGDYSITLNPGHYVVCEVQQAGWIQSYPGGTACGPTSGGWGITLQSGETDRDNNFGNYRNATKTGMKFEDLNRNSAKDPGEPGLPGWQIRAILDDNGNGQLDPGEVNVVATDTTNAAGVYSFTLKPGKYIVCEQFQPGWFQSYPVNTACGSFAGWGITLTSGQVDTDNDFGNWSMATKSGMKFDDLNANGVKDPGEPGLGGWTILAFADTNHNGSFDAGEPLNGQAFTDPTGAYSMSLAPGSYTVCEVPQATWIQSYPANQVCLAPATGGWAITLVSRQIDDGNDFGNYRNATKSGMKFDDLNANGLKDLGEPGLPGWTINAFADLNGNGVLDPAELIGGPANSALTDGSGAYSMQLKPGKYVVCEVQQAGWIQSFPSGTACGPISGGYGITLISGQQDTDNDFGNYRNATKTGTKFNDLNFNHQRDEGEPGLQGWTINAYADDNGNGTLDPTETTISATDVTNADGNYSLTLKPGKYIVCEVLKPTWIQSYPVNTVCGPNAGGWAITLQSGETDRENNFGNFQKATKTGMKFDDLNANGQKDAGEPGLPGWVIKAFVDTNANGSLDAGETTVAATDTTNASGVYTLTLDPGQYVVCEVQQAGWIQSYPVNEKCGAGAGGWGITLTSGQLDDNNDFGNYRNATKSGVKFEDMNANGVKDAGEPLLPNWTIQAYNDVNGNGTLDAGDTLSASTTTNGSGAYSFSLKPGKYVVCEVQQAGWIQSFPSGAACANQGAGYGITLTSGQQDTDNDFGNYRKATKTGMKFDDLNADGVKDAGEPGLPGWVIRAYKDTDGNGSLGAGETTIAASDTTNAGGVYTLLLDPGKYVVCEVAQAGWTQSKPTGTACSAIAGLAPGGWAITLVSNQLDDNNDFGNWRTATKSGTKFNDLNANGVKDAGEPGLAGFVIYVDYNDNSTPDAGEPKATSAADGSYLITDVNPGTYNVREVQQAGWICSYPSPCFHHETFTSGAQVTDNNFGNYQNATKSGVKFEDLNANGVKDAGEPGLSGWTIQAFVDANGNGTKEVGETTVAQSAVTGAGGAYSMSLTPGKYVVCEVLQAGWNQSFPSGTACGASAAGYGITLTSGQLDNDNDFGNYRNATKSGVKFEDLNANGVKDAGEPGLTGWTITAFVDVNGNGTKDAADTTVGGSAVTGAAGAYSMSLKPGKYVVCETLQAGWIQSLPAGTACGANAGGYGITLASNGVDSDNDFGNYRNATKTGTKFDDLNANGAKDAGEPGLQGWTITAFVDVNGNGTKDAADTAVGASGTTNASGVYSLSLKPGKYVVCETQQVGWIQSFPANTACGAGAGGWGITLASNQLDDNNDFGNYRNATKTGIKFEDLNANGVWDSQGESPEPGLAGWTIQAFVDANGNGIRDAGENTVAASTVTGVGGAYTLTLTPGKYIVCEVQQAGWIQSFPSGNACGTGSAGYGITLASGELDSSNNFGNYRNATKTGVKFRDLNRDHEREQGEPGLQGWTIRAYVDTNGNGILDAGETTIAGTGVTDVNGVYSITLKPGKYVVCEVLQANWRQEVPGGTACQAIPELGPAGYGITLTSGQTDSGNDFGNSPIGNLIVTKTDEPDPVTVGQNITYTITVKNAGSQTATQVVVTDPLPLAQVTFVSVSTTQGTCTGTGPVICDIGTMAPGQVVTITIVVRADVTGTVINPVHVGGLEEETTLTDNDASTPTLVVAPLIPPSCGSLKLSRQKVTVGRRFVILATVRDTKRHVMRNVLVRARNLGVHTQARTNKNGVAKLAVTARSAGIMRFTVPGFSRCSATIRATAPFLPPLTGRP